MNKSRVKKSMKFLFFILIICLVVFGGYYFITGKSNPISDLIDNITNEKAEILDNYNGIYVSYDDLNGSNFVFRGCSVSKIANYILIMDEEYYLYRSSCMGTFLKGEGKTSELKISTDETAETYRIDYDDRTFVKDSSVLEIVPGIEKLKLITAIQPDTYQLLLKETEQEGYYYDLDGVKIDGLSSNLAMDFKRNSLDGSYSLGIRDIGSEYYLYSYFLKNLDYLPDLYAFGKNLVIIEKNMNSDDTRYAYRFKVLTKDGITYNSDNMFPIIIDNVSLTTENSVYITFDQSTRNFKMLVGYDKKFCDENYTEENKDEIAYYEFTISYLYNQSTFTKPEFSKIGYKSEGCNYVNKILE